MAEALQTHLVALGDKVRATALPSENKKTAEWCIGQLPPLYAKLQSTNESRYCEEITRLLQGVLKELTNGEPPCPKAQKLAASFPARLQLLHEQLGLPGLGLKLPGALPVRSRKAR